jgi:phosphoglycolate phosphatase-like HAD superfamily hydrolase
VLFLFDIDGTLLRRLPPAHRRALCEACRTVYGVEVEPVALGLTAGMTDTAITLRLLHAAGHDPAAARAGLPALYAAAADAYDRLVDADLSAYRTPYASEALEWLGAHRAALGLVTGNIQRIAWSKLGAAGLARHFACGAFGDEAEGRDALPPLALARACAAFGREFTRDHVYIVGDTPADIACGAASGLRTIGVATGPEHALEHLRACAPDFVIEDLRGLEALPLDL